MKKSSREKLNLLFSSFLVIGYIICTYFFMTLTSTLTDSTASIIKVAVFVLFGLIVFYATRVGEGIPVKRFSPIVLCVLDIPALYIIAATFAQSLPLHTALASQEVVMIFACVALGYGIPYTFLSGFELAEETEEDDDDNGVLEGGIAEELLAVAEDDECDDEDYEEIEVEVEVEVDDDEDDEEIEQVEED